MATNSKGRSRFAAIHGGMAHRFIQSPRARRRASARSVSNSAVDLGCDPPDRCLQHQRGGGAVSKMISPHRRAGALCAAIRPHDNRLDPRLRRIQPRLTNAAQFLALFIKRNRFVERGIAAFEPVDDLFQRL